NPVTGLTHAQARDIYSGKITNWKTVGGKDEPILAYIRERNSGSQELMEALVMRGEAITITLGNMMASTMIGVMNRIAETKNGLGYTVYYYQSVMVPDRKIRLLAVDGVLPSSASIADGT
ncbi:MAG TPA: substrate-binding domain-containing protein, partial [Armatimonadota bacterium]